MKAKDCIIGLKPVENFEEFEKSFFSHFNEDRNKRDRLVSLITEDGHAIRVQIKLLEAISPTRSFGNYIFFIGRVFEIKEDPNSLAGTMFTGPYGGTMPEVKGFISAGQGGLKNFLWSNKKILENEIVWTDSSSNVEIYFANEKFHFSEKYIIEHNVGASFF